MKNNIKLSINAVVITAIVVAAVILLNTIFSVISSKLPMKIDLTKDKVYEFSDYTKEVMKSVDEEILVYALYPSNSNGNEYVTYAEEYLKKYENLNKNFKVTYIDPYENPGFAKKYEQQGQTINAGSIIFECGERVKIVDMEQMYSVNSFSGETQIDMEKKITAAVMDVVGKRNSTKVYFTEGQDEYNSVQLASALMEDGFECETVNIALSGIPEDADIIMMMSPSKDLSQEARDSLDKYLDNGGRAVFVFEPGKSKQPRLDEYLAEWGIAMNYDYVIESDSDYAFQFQSGLAIPAPKLAEHKITEKLIEQKLVFMAPAASSMTLNTNNINYAAITPLLTTSEKSWGKIDFTSNVATKEEGDTQGPLTVAALAERQGSDTGKIMVVGSLQALELDSILNETSYANGDFMLNAVGYLTETETSMDIRAKVISASRLTMSQAQVSAVWIVLQYMIPLAVLALGLFVWFKRRYK